MKRLLVVDDDYSMRMILQQAMSCNGYEVSTAKDGKSALEFIERNPVDLVITDLVMPGIDGIELMETVKRKHPGIGFLLITAYGTIERAVSAMQKGAFDFITKPFNTTYIHSRVDQFFNFRDLKEENKRLKQKLTYAQKYNRLIGESPEMLSIFHHIDVVAACDVPVFIEGESGTGKELISIAIHENSDRADQPFLRVNCCAIPESLFESTLFGHEKGSFTSAYRQHRGMFEEADGGTLLLDEINELPPGMQAKLLRVLQERTITRIGNTKEIPVDVRVIATTNKNIVKLVEGKQFREDLYFRLNVYPIRVPPLRQRSSDIPVLVRHFLDKFKDKYGYDRREVSAVAMDKLMAYSWPGNVRELENRIERAILSAADKMVLEVEHFALETDNSPTTNRDLEGLVTSISEMERILIFNALKQTGNHRTKAAKILGITTRTLRNKLHQSAEQGFAVPAEG